MLLVEDDLILSETLGELLVDAGWTVVRAPDGAQALSMISFMEDRPTVVITDYHLPDMDGARLGQELRRVGVTAPVLVLTGLADQVLHDAQETGLIQKILPKPVTKDVLLKELNGCLALRDRSSEPSAEPPLPHSMESTNSLNPSIGS